MRPHDAFVRDAIRLILVLLDHPEHPFDAFARIRVSMIRRSHTSDMVHYGKRFDHGIE